MPASCRCRIPRCGGRPAIPARRRCARARPAVGPTRSAGRSGRHLDQGFRPDIEGLRAIAVIAVVVYHARLFGLHGGFVGVDVFFVVSGFLITRLILGELAKTGRLSLAVVLGSAGPPAAGRLGARRRRHRARHAPPAAAAHPALRRHRRGRRGDVHVQLRVRRPAGELLRRPARPVDPVAAVALLVARRRGAVLPLLAAAARPAHPPSPAVSPAAARDHRNGRRPRLRARRVDDAAGAVVGVLPPADPHGRAAGRRAARRRRHAGQGDPGRDPGRARLVRPGRHRRRLRSLRRDDAVARHRRPRAGAGHDGGHRRRIGHPDPVGAGAGPARQWSAVGRTALVRAVPLALAGARAGRSPLGPARLDRAVRRGGGWPSGSRRSRSGSSRIRSATPAGWRPSLPAAWPSVRPWCW